MSDEVLTSIIVTTPATLLALSTLIVQIKSIKKVEAIHQATNSMKDALVKATEAEALARGTAEGRAAAAREQKDH